MNILLVGIDYFAYRGSGDKNFWFQLIPQLVNEFDNVFVISFNYRKEKTENQQANITILNVRPYHLGIDIKMDHANFQNKDKCHNHFQKQPRSLIERTITILKIVPMIKKIISENDVKIVHFMDNFGPIMGLIKPLFSHVFFSSSAISYSANGIFQDKYLKYSFKLLNSVVPYSKSYEKKLVEIGIPLQKVHSINWGIKPSNRKIDLFQKNIAKRELGLSSKDTVVLWTGFIQQIREDSLIASLKIAEKVLQKKNKVRFFFTLKPECFKEEYLNHNNDRITVCCTNQEEFNKILSATDILISPVTKRNTIVAPPLSWLECMSIGIPVFTTSVAGAKDVIKHRWNGSVSESCDKIIDDLIMSIEKEDYYEMGQNARNHVEENYNISRIAISYAQFWRKYGKKL